VKRWSDLTQSTQFKCSVVSDTLVAHNLYLVIVDSLNQLWIVIIAGSLFELGLRNVNFVLVQSFLWVHNLLCTFCPGFFSQKIGHTWTQVKPNDIKGCWTELLHFRKNFFFFHAVAKFFSWRNAFDLLSYIKRPFLTKVRVQKEAYIRHIIAASILWSLTFNLNPDLCIDSQVKVISHCNFWVLKLSIGWVNLAINLRAPERKAFSAW